MREDLLLKLSILTVYQHRVPMGGGGVKKDVSLILSNILNYKREGEYFFGSCVPFLLLLHRLPQPAVHLLSSYKELTDMINVKSERIKSHYRYIFYPTLTLE